ncbi:MAG: hypothetical protein GC179_03560 [Anaerolineaceae bacterium]|nr:hypothetical protein [Anaerolineaceae bacterium]
MEQSGSYMLIIVLTILSGVADAQGFLHAARLWQNGILIWGELALSALGFAIGILLYWIVLRNMNEVGITSPEIQTVTWFGVTLIGVALVSGSFLKWTLLDQAVAVAVLFGIGWLMFRTAS